MNLFGMGTMEILVIAVVALIIFGPGRLPEIGAQAGRAVRDFRKATTNLTAEFQDSINDVQATVGEMKDTVREVQRETSAMARSIPESIEGTATRPVAARSTAQPIGSVETDAFGDDAPDSAESRELTTDDAPAEPKIPEIAATRSDPFADLASLDDDEVAITPANNRV